MKCGMLLKGGLLCVVLVYGGKIAWGAEQQSSTPSTPSVGQQAVHVVLKHYVLNPTALDPKTGNALPRDGAWSVGTTPPASCPSTKERCMAVFYQVPAESVRCSWVVLLNADGTDGNFLEEDDDTVFYMLRKASESEAKTLVTTRAKALYPPIAMAAHVNGTVAVDAIVDPTGGVQKVIVASGPEMLRATSSDAVRKWAFLPMMVGSRAIPYEIEVSLRFQTSGLSNGTVNMTP